MPIELDTASTSGGGQGASSITWSHTASGSDRLLFVGLMFTGAPTQTVTSVTFNGVNLTQSFATIESVISLASEGWYLVMPDTGTHDIVITFSGSPADSAAGAASYTGVHQSTPLGTPVTANANSTGPATVDVSSASDELVIAALGHLTLGNDTPGSGITERWDGIANLDPNYQSSGGDKAGEASTTMTWTLTGTVVSWAIGGVALKPAATIGRGKLLSRERNRLVVRN